MANTSGNQIPLEETKLTDRLVTLVAETKFEDLPPATLVSAKQLILDTIGVSLTASTHEVGKIISQYALDMTGKPATATIFGAKEKVSASKAALANGTMANALDFDGGGHLPTHILPTALAVAEQEGRSGRDVLATFILAYEAANKLTKIIEAKRRSGGSSPTKRGWWHVGLVGPIATAMAASRLMGQSKQQMAMAVGISTTSSAGFRRNMGTMSKALHSGNAAAAGIDAAVLAGRGFTGDPEILEAPLGFVFSVAPPEERDTTAVTEGLANPYTLEKNPGVKNYPAVTPSHCLIDAAKEIRERDKIDIDAIDSIHAQLTPLSLFRHDATDEESAGFCGEFLISLALVHGAVTLAHYRDEVLHDAKIRGLMARVKHATKDDMNGHTLIVKLKDGRELVSDVAGGERRITDLDSMLEKFDHCAGQAVSKKAVGSIRDIVLDLENQPTIDPLMAAAGGRI